MKIKYKDIYDEAFLEKFGKYRERVENLELVDSYKIDVNAVAEACDMWLVHMDFDDEIGYNAEDRVVRVFSCETDFFNRYYASEGLCAALCKDLGIKETHDNHMNFMEMMNTFRSPFFTYSLLFPRKLFRMVIEDVERRYGYDERSFLNETDRREILRKVSGAFCADTKIVMTLATMCEIFTEHFSDLGVYYEL